jgi:predicted nucleic acid-binding OB-fold protein
MTCQKPIVFDLTTMAMQSAAEKLSQLREQTDNFIAFFNDSFEEDINSNLTHLDVLSALRLWKMLERRERNLPIGFVLTLMQHSSGPGSTRKEFYGIKEKP